MKSPPRLFLILMHEFLDLFQYWWIVFLSNYWKLQNEPLQLYYQRQLGG